MPYLLNALYLVGLIFFSPFLLYKALTTGKYRRGLLQKFFGLTRPTSDSGISFEVVRDGRPLVWFHGVSVGEIHLLRPIVARFRSQYPHWVCAISATTDTGYDEARKRFPDLH